MTHSIVHGSHDQDLDPDPSYLDLGSQEIIDPSLRFVERFTGIIDPTNEFGVGPTGSTDFHHINFFNVERLFPNN